MNIKWYVNELGIKVKKCAICRKEFPYSFEYFRVMNNKGKLGAYCAPCEREYHKKLRTSRKKTNRINIRHLPYSDGRTTYKKCNICEKDFPYTDVYFDKSPNKKLKPYCRDCRLLTSKKQKKTNWQKTLLRNARASTSYKNLKEMDIDENFILHLWNKQMGKCFWFGVDMIPSMETKTLLQPSLDRLDRNKGYTKDNVVLCCFVANFGRNENTEESWKQFLKKLKSQLDYDQWNK